VTAVRMKSKGDGRQLEGCLPLFNTLPEI